MTDKEIIKALERCNCKMRGVYCMKQRCPYFNVSLCRDHLMEDALDLIKRQNAKIDTLQKQVRVLGGLPKMALPYDEDEFLRKAILEVIKWIEEMPNYKICGTIVLTKARVDEMKDRIKEIGNDNSY